MAQRRSDGLITQSTRILLAESEKRIREFHEFLDNYPRSWSRAEAERLVVESHETRRRLREFLEMN
jgi:hypothetical protein